MGPLVFIWLAAFSVETGGQCPAEHEVRAELERLRPNLPARALVVREEGGSLWLELEGMPGRSVPAPDDCRARARTVAVIVASWLGELEPLALRLPTMPEPGWGSAVALSGGAGFDGTVAGNLGLSFRLLPWRRLSFELGAHVQSLRGLRLSAGRAEYWRLGAVVGGVWVFRAGARLGVRAALALLPGAFVVRGNGFDVNYFSAAPEIGVRMTLQFGVFLAPIELWVGPFGQAWPAVQQLRDATQVLGAAPAFEAGIVFSVGWGERFWRKRAWGNW